MTLHPLTTYVETEENTYFGSHCTFLIFMVDRESLSEYSALSTEQKNEMLKKTVHILQAYA